jgi:hypothetical protein
MKALFLAASLLLGRTDRCVDATSWEIASADDGLFIDMCGSGLDNRKMYSYETSCGLSSNCDTFFANTDSSGDDSAGYGEGQFIARTVDGYNEVKTLDRVSLGGNRTASSNMPKPELSPPCVELTRTTKAEENCTTNHVREQAGPTGAGVKVYVIDTVFFRKSFISTNFTRDTLVVDATNCFNQSDSDEHGTHEADNNDINPVGLLPEVFADPSFASMFDAEHSCRDATRATTINMSLIRSLFHFE